MKTSEFNAITQSLKDVGCSEIAQGHEFVVKKYAGERYTKYQIKSHIIFMIAITGAKVNDLHTFDMIIRWFR